MWYLPATHTLQSAEPAALVVFAGHALHDALPVTLAYRPASHAVHITSSMLVAAVRPYFPDGQGVPLHAVALPATLWYVPLGHAAHRAPHTH